MMLLIMQELALRDLRPKTSNRGNGGGKKRSQASAPAKSVNNNKCQKASSNSGGGAVSLLRVSASAEPHYDDQLL